MACTLFKSERGAKRVSDAFDSNANSFCAMWLSDLAANESATRVESTLSCAVSFAHSSVTFAVCAFNGRSSVSGVHQEIQADKITHSQPWVDWNLYSLLVMSQVTQTRRFLKKVENHHENLFSMTCWQAEACTDANNALPK